MSENRPIESNRNAIQYFLVFFKGTNSCSQGSWHMMMSYHQLTVNTYCNKTGLNCFQFPMVS